MRSDENNIDTVISLLRKHYWTNIILLAALFLLTLFRVVSLFQTVNPVSVTIERYSIVISIIAIPAALKLFAYILKKIPVGTDNETVITKYKVASYTRLYIISAITLMNIVLYAYSFNMNFFWFTVVLFIIYVFCKPSYPELENVVNRVTEEEIKETDNE